MGPELIIEIVGYARAIYDAVQQAEANHKQSKRLSLRVTQLSEQLQGLPVISTDKRWLADLNTLLELVKEILAYTQKFQKKHYLKKLLFNGTHSAEFAEFTERLASAKHDLLFGIGVQGVFNREDDKHDEAADRQQMEQRHAELLAAFRESQSAAEKRFQVMVAPALPDLEAEIKRRHQIAAADFQLGAVLRSTGGAILHHASYLEMPVLVKKLNILTAAAKTTFLRETTINARLRSRSILQLRGACFEPGQECIIFEDAEQTLAARLKQSPLTLNERTALLREVTLGLVYLHERFGAHGDLNLVNVVLSDDSAKLTGFAFASVQASTVLKLGEVEYGGGFCWLSPERLNGSVKAASREADIYSFGLLLWSLFTAREPFAGTNDVLALLPQAKNAATQLAGDLPAEYRTLFKSCCAINPDERPCARDLLLALEAVQPQQRKFLGANAEESYQKGKVAEMQKDFINAARHYQLAATQAHAKAKTNLATFYREGLGGLPKDLARWFSLSLEAAKAGSERAMFNVAMSYEKGIGIGLDRGAAKEWYQKALAAGFADARLRLEKLSLSYA